MVYQAEYLPQRNRKSVIEALAMANNVDEEVWDPRIWESQYGGVRSITGPHGGRRFLEGMERVVFTPSPPSLLPSLTKGNRFCV